MSETIMSRRILIVEDSPILREVMLFHLHDLNVSCNAVSTGEEAIELAENYDMLLMDIKLPGMSGVEASRKIRKLENEKCLMPSIIVATTSEDNRAECLAAGMNDFYSKPLYRADLAKIVEKWLSPNSEFDNAWRRGALKIMNNGDFFQAGSTATPLEVLTQLAISSCARVRVRVAENHASTPNLLELLSRDSNADVRIAVGHNPSTPIAIRWKLAFDEHVDVRFSLADNANTALLILIWLSADENPYIAHRALRTISALLPGNRKFHSEGDLNMSAKTIEHTLRRMLNAKERLSKKDAIQIRELILEDNYLSRGEKKIVHEAIENDLLSDEAFEILIDLVLERSMGVKQSKAIA